MLNRRHIRIKVMQIIFAMKGTESDGLNKPEEFLITSMAGMYDLYLLMLSLLVKVQNKAERYLVIKQKQHLATEAEKNPSKKFLNNAVLSHFKENKDLSRLLETRKLNNWEIDAEYVDVIFKLILKSDPYKTYMGSAVSSFDEDLKFVQQVYKTIIAPNDKLYDYFEDKKITWLDDLPIVNTVILKMLKKMIPARNRGYGVLSLFKDMEDRQFGIDLLNKTLLNLNIYNSIIEEKTTNWDKDRIARLDLVLLQMALCEIQEFPSIPIKVTINEYLEIAKEYSTPKSSVFINGILDKLVKEYEAKGTLNKAGRGLM